MTPMTTSYAGGTGALPVGTLPGERRGRSAGFWVRTVLATGIGIVAAGLLSLAGILTVFALVVVSPEHPGRALTALLSVPELRHDAADSLVGDVEEERGGTFAPATREVLVAATDDALGAPDVLAALAAIPLVDGRLDSLPYVDAIAVELDRQADATGDPEARRVLSTYADELPRFAAGSVGESSAETDTLDFAGGLGEVRRYGLVAAAVVGVLGLVALLVATAIAVHRGLAAALVTSAALVATALVLAPGEWLLGRGDGVAGALAHVVAAAGELAGSGLLASLVPPALWSAARSVRRTA
jgi:hypothetical protein